MSIGGGEAPLGASSGSREAKGSQALFRVKLLFFYAVAFFGEVRPYRENRQNSLGNRRGT